MTAVTHALLSHLHVMDVGQETDHEIGLPDHTGQREFTRGDIKWQGSSTRAVTDERFSLAERATGHGNLVAAFIEQVSHERPRNQASPENKYSLHVAPPLEVILDVTVVGRQFTLVGDHRPLDLRRQIQPLEGYGVVCLR